jgi:hypothetical protein
MEALGLNTSQEDVSCSDISGSHFQYENKKAGLRAVIAVLAVRRVIYKPEQFSHRSKGGRNMKEHTYSPGASLKHMFGEYTCRKPGEHNAAIKRCIEARSRSREMLSTF